MPYINRYSFDRNNRVETVDEFPTYKECREMLKEYREADRSAAYAVSQRPTKAWHQAKQTAEITAILYEKGYLEMD